MAPAEEHGFSKGTNSFHADSYKSIWDINQTFFMITQSHEILNFN